MRLSARRLNRTLLLRQHLLERADLSPTALVEHLVGLQAQDPLPPYLGLAARLSSFDPYDVSRLLESAGLVRLSTLRGTIHLHTPRDAALMRAWTQPVHDAATRRVELIRPADGLPGFAEALAEVTSQGPVTMSQLESGLARHFPGVPVKALAYRARNDAPLVQLPPRGLWQRSGGVVYQPLSAWSGQPPVEPAHDEIVHRYLRAFGPATAADLTAWSGLSRLAPVMNAMDLVHHEDDTGRTLYDVPDGVLAEEDEPAPVRLLGTYDNVWLSHSIRDRVMPAEARSAWAGRNGGMASVILVGGYATGLWKPVDGRVGAVRLLRDLTPDERDQLAEETARVEELLAR